jgi:glycosyltransferase involved in cell wall biosynthesis
VKTPVKSKTIAEQEVTTRQSPIKVCLHILRSAKNDVRAMRASSALVEAGFDVSIIDVECVPALPREEKISGVRLLHMIIPHWFTSRRFQPWFFLVAVKTFFLSMWRLYRSQADIYHAQELTALLASFLVAKLRRKPLIFEAYELHLPVPETSIPFWRLLGGIVMRLLALILPRCQGIIAASPLYAQELSRRYHLPEVVPIRNVPPYRAVQKSDRLRQKLDLLPEMRIVLYQGGIQRNRSLDILVRAARFLDESIVIIMMGKTVKAIQDELEALAASEDVADRVKIIPPVPYEELLDWTASADIGLTLFSPDYSLSIRMTQPNKLFEYMMAGVPILSTQLEAIVEIIRTYDVGQVVSSLEPADIAVAINAMLADQNALERMRHNAWRAAKDCCWEQESHHLLRLYERILTK